MSEISLASRVGNLLALRLRSARSPRAAWAPGAILSDHPFLDVVVFQGVLVAEVVADDLVDVQSLSPAGRVGPVKG